MSVTDLRVPDALGEFVGWRAWRITDNRLASDYTGGSDRTAWHPGEVALARCLRRQQHLAPDSSCTCGFYAVKSREYLVSLGQYHRYSPEKPVVIGEVALSGKVIIATHGWRAEQAWPLSLRVPHVFWRYAAELEEAYGIFGVKVELDNTVRAEAKGG